MIFMGRDLGVKFGGALSDPRVTAGVLARGVVFCSLKEHPERVGQKPWQEEMLSLDMAEC